MRKLYLIRHPQPAVAAGICYGRSNLPLAEDAAVAARRLLPLLPLAAPLFCSPLERCHQLALALTATPEVDARLQEIDFGHWEMQPWEGIERSAIDAWAAAPLHFREHGGESVVQLRSRVEAFLAELQHAEAILVTHSGVMKLMAAILLDLPQQEWMEMRFDFATVSLIETNDSGESRLVWHNSAHA